MKKIDYHEHQGPELASGVASANECTGLLYRAPENEEERENAQDLLPLEVPPAPRKNRAENPRLEASPGDR